jgi:hypothetical protein
MDAASALTILTTERLLTVESIRRPRIVLVASDFPASVTSAVVWLNEQSVDISLIRYRPYGLADGQLVVSFTRLYPTALKFPGFCDLVSGFLRLVTVWLHVGRGGVTGSDGP